MLKKVVNKIKMVFAFSRTESNLFSTPLLLISVASPLNCALGATKLRFFNAPFNVLELKKRLVHSAPWGGGGGLSLSPFFWRNKKTLVVCMPKQTKVPSVLKKKTKNIQVCCAYYKRGSFMMCFFLFFAGFYQFYGQ